MISIIHPTRGRIAKAYATAKNWIDKAARKDIEYILSIDDDENHLYYNFPRVSGNVKTVTNANKNVVDAMNAGAKRATGNILVCISDDFDCPKHWDLLIKQNINHKKEEALLVNDGINYGGKTRMALPILTKKLYDRLGYVYFPGYTGMFADDDLKEICMRMSVLRDNQDLLFQHNHYVNGKVPMDATYKRHNTKESYNLGLRIIEKRRKENFGL